MAEIFNDKPYPFADIHNSSDVTAAAIANRALLQEFSNTPLRTLPAELTAAAEKTAADSQTRSYLQTLINAGTSILIKNNDNRNTVNRITGDFIKTTSLSTSGKAGLVSTFITHGLDQARPADSLKVQAADFALGGAKGETARGILSVFGGSDMAAPLKGVLMGISFGTANEVFKRETFTTPSSLNDRLRNNVFDQHAVWYDAAQYTTVKGLYSGINLATDGALSENKMASSMVMSGSSGFINGSTSEFTREKQDQGTINLKEVLRHGVLEASTSVAGVCLGEQASDRFFSTS
jgi:hypothetical protein